MIFTVSSGDRHWPLGSHYAKARRRRHAGGRGRRRLVYDPLESRQLLALSAPVAEFPARTLGGTPVGNVVDPSGNDWVLLSSGNIAEINNSGGVVAQFPVPSYNSLAGAPTGSELGLITYDAVDKNLWFYETNSNKFGMLNPSSGAITEFPALFFSANPAIYQIAAGPDGNIWFTEPNLNDVGVFDIKTGVISQFTMPLPDTQPQGITAGADGDMWFTEGGLNQLGSINPVTHVLKNYAYEPPGYINNDQAEGITAGPNNTILFLETQNNQVMEFNIKTQTFTSSVPALPVPAPMNPPPAQLWSIGQGPDGNIYYTEPAFNGVGELDPSTQENGQWRASRERGRGPGVLDGCRRQ
jgi:virginiamycin B lyase